MGQIIELRPLRQRARGAPKTEALPEEVVPVDEAVQRLGGPVAELIRTLEESHRRIRLLIYSIPDAEVAARLTQDLADLSLALSQAKAKACATGLIPRE